MSIVSIFNGLLTKSRKTETVVRADAEALVGVWGETAYEVAANLSRREDCGLMQTSSPGHWARVQREIGLMIGVQDEPVFDQKAMAA